MIFLDDHLSYLAPFFRSQTSTGKLKLSKTEMVKRAPLLVMDLMNVVRVLSKRLLTSVGAKSTNYQRKTIMESSAFLLFFGRRDDFFSCIGLELAL